MSKNLLAHWSANFPRMMNMRNLRMTEGTNELASLASYLNLESEEIFIEEYMQLAGEELLMQSTTWLSWGIWHGVEKSIWI